MVSLEEIVEIALERSSRRLSGHCLEVDIAPDLPNLFVDAASIAEAVYSLLDNAAKYSRRGSRVRISAWRESANALRFAVEDQGRSIDEKHRERIFEKFFRVPEQEASEGTGGLGVGLAIARGVVESQGGRIWVENGIDEFITRAVIELPVGNETVDTGPSET
jgi:two-component system sensor histidine kinase KdpD